MRVLHAIGHALTITGIDDLADPVGLDLRVRPVGSGPGGGPQEHDRQAPRGRSAPDAGRRHRTGAASSSCSYAAVALARSLFRRGASFTAAMAFEIASTNLVIELGVILAVLIGWQFTLAEFVGGPIMIVLIAVPFRLFLRQRLIDEAREQSRQGAGRLDGGPRRHGHDHRRRGQPLASPALTAGPHLGLPHLRHGVGRRHPGHRGRPVDRRSGRRLGARQLLAPFSSPSTIRCCRRCGARSSGRSSALLSFVCSIGNVPLAGVLWNAGISFGGVISFIFADLIILPILAIYRKYYGTRMMLFILASFYATMVAAGYIVEILFSVLGSGPHGERREGRRDGDPMELHHGAQHRGALGCRRPHLSLRPNRWYADAQDDGWATR